MKIGSIFINAAYLGSKVLTAIAVGATKLWEAVKYIVFKDPVVAKICAENWGDGVGITPEQAAAVTNIGTTFHKNTEITSFKELEMFGISHITNSAFASCSALKSIRFPNSLTIIYGYALQNTSISDINVPDNLKEIGDHAFTGGNVEHRDVHINNINNWFKVKTGTNGSVFTGSSENHVYSNGNIVTSISIPADVVDVQFGALCNTVDITDVLLHDSIISIKDYAFSGCSSLVLNTLNLSNLTTLGSNSFAKVKIIEDVNLPSLTSISDAAFHSSGVKKVSNLGNITSLPGGQWSHNGIFRNCTSLVSVELPETLESITSSSGYSYCFYGCTSLETININHVKEIGSQAFANCTSLSININNPHLTRISGSTFSNCGELTVNLPNVTEVAATAFANSKLKGILALPSAEIVKYRAFYNTLIEKVYLDRVKEIYGNDSFSDWGAFNGCANLTHVVLSDCVEYLQKGVFYNCKKLESVVLPTVTPPEIGTLVFPNTCSIYVPDESVKAYKEATNWSAYGDRIKPLSEYVEPTNE